jgi:hypothetical protein
VTARRSNREKARLAVMRLEAEIAAHRAAGETLPLNGRALHIGLICRTLGVSRSTAHQNPAFRAVLEAYAAEEGLLAARDPARADGTSEDQEAAPELVPAARLRQEQRRADAAERRIAELVARNAALAARIRRFEAAEEELLVAGRRHRPVRSAETSALDDVSGSLDLPPSAGRIA